MDISPQLEEGAPFIARYGGGGFVIGNTRYEGSVLIHGNEITPLSAIHIDDLQPEILAMLDADTELLLIGTGDQLQFPPASLRQYATSNQIPHDIMDTGAACRTFNIVLEEGRKAAALLLAI